MRIRLSKNTMPSRKGGVLSIIFRKGAGTVGGATLFAAWKSGSKLWRDVNRCGSVSWTHNRFDLMCIGHLEFGFTRNANIVPYASWL